MTLANRSADELWVCNLGTVPYREALAIQERVRARRQAEELPDTLLLLEHPPVYTRGRRSQENELPIDEEEASVRGIEVITTDRGGRVTYHAPGQLVGYPIIAIKDVGAYLRTMESAIISALSQLGIEARTRCAEGPDYTGVWVQDRKIASIGVHVWRKITTHGFAINVDLDLSPFSWVISCGLPDVEMTSLARELASRGGAPGHEQVRAIVAEQFCLAHGRRAHAASLEQLTAAGQRPGGRPPGDASAADRPSQLAGAGARR
jgi:lipoyl(octanoyl) transferase